MTDGQKDCILVVVVALMFAIIGGRVNEVYLHHAEKAPSCQEDEYLYPVDTEGNPSFNGPGVAQPSDYGCFNFDDNEAVTCDAFETDEVICVDGYTGKQYPMVASAMVICPDGNVYYKPDVAPC